MGIETRVCETNGHHRLVDTNESPFAPKTHHSERLEPCSALWGTFRRIAPQGLAQSTLRFLRLQLALRSFGFRILRHPRDSLSQKGDQSHTPNPSLGTIEVPPYYAGKLRSGALATKGGLRVNAAARVIAALSNREDAEEGLSAIPGLYAAGNVSSAAVPGAYTGPGATIGPAMTFAYIAALDASSSCQ